MPALRMPARLPKHVPQTGIAQPDAETALSSSSVCAVGALTSRSPRVSAPEYPLFILIAGPSIFRGCSSLTWKARCFCLALSILGRSLPVCGVCHLLAQRSSIYVWLCDAKKRIEDNLMVCRRREAIQRWISTVLLSDDKTSRCTGEPFNLFTLDVGHQTKRF